MLRSICQNTCKLETNCSTIQLFLPPKDQTTFLLPFLLLNSWGVNSYALPTNKITHLD